MATLRRALEAGERRDRGDEPVAVAVVDLHFGRMPLRSGNGHRIGRDGRYDIDQRHQPVVLVVEAMAVHHEEPGEIVELHAQASAPGWMTDSSGPMVGAGTLALSTPHISGPVSRPVVGSK